MAQQPHIENREVRLIVRPQGMPRPEDFQLAIADVRQPAEGEALVKNLFMSVDPYMRGRMNDVPSYVPPFRLGEALDGGAVGRVERSRAPTLQEGDLVISAHGGWRERVTGPERWFERLEAPVAPLSSYLGVLGMPGLTAYVGLLDVAHLAGGETVFVSGAAGAVGGLVGQIAKLKGCRVIGSAGTADKVRHLVGDLRFDAAFGYRDEAPRAALARLAPDGIDVYFDNVGGDHLEAAIGALRPHGRVVLCGAISRYNATGPVPGPGNLAVMIGQRLTMTGFIVSDHLARTADFRRDVSRWLAEGRVSAPETVYEGIEQAVPAFLDLLRGRNVGKMVVRL